MKKSIYLLFIMFLFGCEVLEKGNNSQEFSLYYYNDINEERKEKKVLNNEFYEIDIPSKEGYIFLGFYDDIQNGSLHVNASGKSLNKYNYDTDLILYGRWEKDEYKIILDSNGGLIENNEIIIGYNEYIYNLPGNVVKDNYIFIGWFDSNSKMYSNSNGTLLYNLFNNENFNIENKRTILYAHYELITHNVVFNIGSTKIKKEVPHNSNLSDYIPKEIINGKYIISWSIDNKVEYKSKITENIDLYPLEYANILSFDTGEGNIIEPLILKPNTKLHLPVAVWDNNIFDGWFDEEGNLFKEEYMPDKSFILKAKFNPMINFENTKGILVNPITKLYNEEITLPVLYKENYTFLGWTDKDGVSFNSNVMPKNGITLYAKWLGDRVNIVFNSNGGSLINELNTRYGEFINSPSDPINGSLTFKGWYLDEEFKYKFEFGEVNYSDITLYAKWEISYTLIKSVNDLINVNNDLSGNYKLVNNLDLKDINFIPIGINSSFTGIFDGQGFIISNLSIVSDENKLGLFSNNRGVIKNIGLENFLISSSNKECYIGGITSSNDGTIIDSYVYGNIHKNNNVVNTSSLIGGISGINKGDIVNCFSNVNIKTGYIESFGNKEEIGGIVGQHFIGSIENCISILNITYTGYNNTYRLGSLIGSKSENSLINNSYRLTSSNLYTNELGELISINLFKNEEFIFNTLNWDKKNWVIKNNSYPILVVSY